MSDNFQDHAVSGVTFESVEDSHGYGAVKHYHETKTPKLVSFVVRNSVGIIKTENQAVYFIVGIFLIIIVASAFVSFGGGTKNTPAPKKLVDKAMRDAIKSYNKGY